MLGDDDINSMLAAYADAYKGTTDTAEADTSRAEHASVTDWSAVSTQLPGEAEKELEEALHDDDATVLDSAPPMSESTQSLMRDAESPSKHNTAHHSTDLGESGGVGSAPEALSAKPASASWRDHLPGLESQVDENPSTWVSLNELNSYYLQNGLDQKKLDKLHDWLHTNKLPTKAETEAATHDLGEGAQTTSDAAPEYRIADLHYALMSLFD